MFPTSDYNHFLAFSDGGYNLQLKMHHNRDFPLKPSWRGQPPISATWKTLVLTEGWPQTSGESAESDRKSAGQSKLSVNKTAKSTERAVSSFLRLSWMRFPSWFSMDERRILRYNEKMGNGPHPPRSSNHGSLQQTWLFPTCQRPSA